MRTNVSRISTVAAIMLPVWVCATVLAQHGTEPTKPAPKPAAQPATQPAPKPMAAAGTGAQIGKPAPEFALKDTTGKEVKLSSFKGKVVVLEWINHECPVVNRVYGANVTANTIAKFKGQPVQWIGIDSSNFAEEKKANITKWATDKKIDFPILLDAAGTVGKQFGAKTTPHMFVIDKEGILAYAGAIDNNPDGSKKDGVRNYVEEAVSALLKGSTVATATTDPYGCSVKYK